MDESSGSPLTGDTSFLERYKVPLILFSGGIFIILLGIRMLVGVQETKVEFIEKDDSNEPAQTQIKVDVTGAVEHPGVYDLDRDSRLQDALLLAGGLSHKADRTWVEREVNLAAKLSDGTKIYIPSKGEIVTKVGAISEPGKVISDVSKDIVNINTASKIELETLPGVGEVTAEKIIANRPYQTVDELQIKKVVNKSTYEKIKQQVSVY